MRMTRPGRQLARINGALYTVLYDARAGMTPAEATGAPLSECPWCMGHGELWVALRRNSCPACRGLRVVSPALSVLCAFTVTAHLGEIFP